MLNRLLKSAVVLTLAALMLFGAKTLFLAEAHASGKLGQIDPLFPVPSGLEGRVAFWRLIFTKYGKNNRVFHHRDYPEMIYSVLDFTEEESRLWGRALQEVKGRAVDAEIGRIQDALENLGAGRAPRTPFERRLVRLFERLPGRGSRKFLDASAIDKIRYQTGVKERFRDGVVRSGRYLYAMELVLEAEGLPAELARLPLVESSFDYTAYSSAGAAGIWQFMRGTGKHYMRITPVLDERKDPIIATRAAAKYLKNAYEDTGEWPLAVTSYNHGLSGIIRAMRESGSKDLGEIIKKYESKSFGFASSNFYCEFLAALEVEQNAQHYFPGIVREAPWHFDEVELAKSVNIGEAVRVAGASREDIQRLNPALGKSLLEGRSYIPGGYLLKVPKGRGNALVASIRGSELKPSLVGESRFAKAARKKDLTMLALGKGQSYTIVAGDSLSSIARRFKVSERDILNHNEIANAALIRAGQRLVIPKEGSVDPDSMNTSPAVLRASAVMDTTFEPAKRASRVETPEVDAPYTEASGNATQMVGDLPSSELAFDPAEGAAGRSGLPPARQARNATRPADTNPPALEEDGMFQRVNLREAESFGSEVSDSSPLSTVQEPVTPKPAKTVRSNKSYVIRSGDTARSIAQRFGVKPQTLLRLNGIKNPRRLRVGSKLLIPGQ